MSNLDRAASMNFGSTLAIADCGIPGNMSCANLLQETEPELHLQPGAVKYERLRPKTGLLLPTLVALTPVACSGQLQATRHALMNIRMR